SMATADRVSLAKTRTEKVVEHFRHLITVHETNRIVLFSDILSRQIPASRAANAFNIFRDSLYRFEIVRLCTLWDGPGSDRESIPTVFALLDCRRVRRMIAEDTYKFHARQEVRIPCPDPRYVELEVEAARRWVAQFALDEARKTIRGISRAKRRADALLNT